MGLLIMSLTFEKMRELVADIGDDFVDEDEARWMEQTEDVENDVFSLCLGFLLMQTIRRSDTRWAMPAHVMRLLKISENVLAICMAWCMLYWGEWQVYALEFDGSRMFGVLLVALLLTAVALSG